jgi:hypothetical protein
MQNQKSKIKIVQNIAKQVGEQSGETLRSVASQVVPEVFGSPNIENVQQVAETGYNQAQFDAETQVKLNALRNRLRQIQEEEEMRARQGSMEQKQEWGSAVAEAMEKKHENLGENVMIPQGKKRRGLFGRGQKGLKTELGRGDKN